MAGFPNLFAPERSVRTDSIDEARVACATLFRYDRPEIVLAQMSLDDTLGLHVNGERYRLTDKAFSDLCDLVRLPVRFAKEIPTDLVASIVQRLKGLHQQAVVLVSRDDIVVGLINPGKWTHSDAKVHRPSYLPVGNTQILDVIEKLRTSSEQSPRITIADSGLQVELLDTRLTLEPRVGDITQVGLAITSSETGGPLPKAHGYTLRLWCTNGATMPEPFGELRFNSDWRVSLERRLAAWEAHLRSFTLDLAMLGQAYDRLATEYLTDHQFYQLYRQARYIYRVAPQGDDRLDTLLDVEPEQRQQFIAQVRQRQNRLRGDLLGASAPSTAQPTPLLAWDVFNSITATAREEPYQRRVALERLAGDLLQAYAPRDLN